MARHPISRRSFVRTASGLLVATGFNAACGATETPSETGSVEVLVTGLDPSATDGGTVTVTAVDVVFDTFTVPIPASGDSGVKSGVPVGHYKGSYTPPANHALAPGETNPKDATISSGQTTTVTWSVVAAQGTVRVNVTGLAGDATSGGSASVLRTDIPGQSPVVLNIPASGTADLGVTIGSYQVSYTPPGGYTLAGGSQNPQSTSVGSGQVATVSFAVAASGTTFQTPDILNNASFESGWDGYSDWSGSASNPPTGNAVRDTTRAFAGTYAVKCALPATNGTDSSAQCIIKSSAAGIDRIWMRKYFYFDAAIDGTLKFDLMFDPGNSIQFAGLYCHGGYLAFDLFPEWSGYTVPHIVIAALTSLVNGWHWVEYDYWRNGDTSNGGNDYPSVAIWLDGTQITSGSLPAVGSWINGRANAGRRDSTAKFGWHYLRSVLNGSPPNTVAGNVWFDRVALSSVGRIGP